MFFTITASNTAAIKQVFAAKRTILLYKQGPNEIALDKFLKTNYHITLKRLCLKLFCNATYHYQDNEVVITFKNKKDDYLASLITYGNGRLQGSNILLTAFKNY